MSPDSDSRRKIRIGICGGRMGSMFYWHEHPDCLVAAVADLNDNCRQLLKKTYRCRQSYRSIRELVKDPAVDAVGIFTEGPMHFEHAMLALNHGKHVISAVPAVMAHSVTEGLDQAQQLLEKVKQTGLTYMMAETSCWQQKTITARRLYDEGKIGDLICCESDYFHPGMKSFMLNRGKPTWRHGVPPMFYPTHCTAYYISLTKDRLTEVACDGWGDGDPILRKNRFGNNPFWNETAHFRSRKGVPLRVRIWWEGPVQASESASWYGTKMTITAGDDVWRLSGQKGRDDAGFAVQKTRRSRLLKKDWWKTSLLPEPLRHASGHDGSHTFITHEFIDALISDRPPAMDIHDALACTVPGIIAHQSALKGGELLKIPQFR